MNVEIPKKILSILDNWEKYGTFEFKLEAQRIKKHLLECPDCQKEMMEDYKKGLYIS